MVDNIDISEISNHVKFLRNKKVENSVEKKDTLEDLLEWKEVDQQSIEPIQESKTIMTNNRDVNLSKRICDICNKTIDLEENLSGLVIHDTHFLCEECCQESNNTELDIWTQSKMASPGDLKPIALWLMKEKNKNSLF